MRLLFFTMLLVPVAAWSKCAPIQDVFYPASGTAVPTNFQIVYETFTKDDAVMNFYLASKTEKIELSYEFFASGVQKVQFILKPKKPLKPNTEYRLKTDKSDSAVSLPKWTTTTVFDSQAPKTMEPVAAKKGTREEFGCGPAIEVVFSNVKSTEPGLLVFRVKTATNESRFLVPQSETVTIGHGMCSGNFDFRANGPGPFRIEFATIDWAGNSGPFTAPSDLVEPAHQ
jgi:hypothetical protein